MLYGFGSLESRIYCKSIACTLYFEPGLSRHYRCLLFFFYVITYQYIGQNILRYPENAKEPENEETDDFLRY